MQGVTASPKQLDHFQNSNYQQQEIKAQIINSDYSENNLCGLAFVSRFHVRQQTKRERNNYREPFESHYFSV